MDISKGPLFLYILFIFGSLFVSGAGEADAGQASTIRYVSPAGSDNGGCTNKSQPCRTIQYAVDHSTPGDEVRLASGEYNAVNAPIADIRVSISLRGGYSTTNWNISNKTANPTTLKVSCAWDSGEAAIEAEALERISIKDLDLNGCGIDSSGELLVERVALRNGQIRHGSAASIPVILSDVTIDGGNFVHASGANSIATLAHITISNSPGEGISEKSAGGLVLSDVRISNCEGAGISFRNGAVPSTVTGALVQENGVGIEASGAGIVTLDQVVILNNAGRGVIDKGAGMVMQYVTIQGNHAVRDDANGDEGDGGGFYTVSGGATLTNVVIRGNSAQGSGGGIYDKSGGLKLSRSTVAGNQAGQTGGGAWSMSGLTFTDTAITGNQAPAGGGIFCYRCLLNLTNSAVSANSTGGIVVQGAETTLLNSLVAGNNGRGIEVIPDILSEFRFDNGLLAQNTTGNCAAAISLVGTHNLSSDASCSFSGESNMTQTEPQLGRLLANGFYSMSSASPAVDQGNPALCPARDYRGFARPLDGNRDGVTVCDIGPLEAGFDIFLPMIRR